MKRKLEALYPVWGLFAGLILIVLLQVLSSCRMAQGLVNEGNKVTPHPTPHQ